MAANEPRWAKSYPANVVLVVLTLFPGLINTSAIALAAPVIGRDLGVAPDTAAAIPLISDAALAFGCVLAAELTRRFDSRTLYFSLLAVSLVSSLASALAPSFAVLLAAHVVHGLAAGMLFIVVLPPLIVNFSSAKLPATASVLVPALFGAVTVGPLLGGLVASPGIWRAIFAAEVVVALVAMLLARSVIQAREPQGSDQPVDWFALVVSGLGSLLIYLGIGGLAANDWRDALASGPFVAGLVMYAVLIVGEARKEHPLVPVRKLATSLALIGTIATVVGSAAFSALTTSFSLTLLRIGELDPHGAGLAFWPEFLTALASGYVFGRAVTTKWVVLVGAVGLGFIALAAALARVVGPVDAAQVGWLSLVGGFGAGLSVSPGLFVVTLSFERALVGRAIALLNLFRLTGGFISAPGVEHTIGSRAGAHLRAADPSVSPHAADAAVRAFITGRTLPSGIPVDALKRALALAIADAYVIVLLLALAGIVAIAALLVATRVKLRAPDLAKFDEGKPALEAPALA
ncbi:MAG TPA: MFS transporter [Candidatus Elarobacter sp.]|jgi:MFS family permease|nr:MFS transporter [Candidatus Elarobacter sp.]